MTETVVIDGESLKTDDKYKKKYEKYKGKYELKCKELETNKNYRESYELQKKNNENLKLIANSLVSSYQGLPQDVVAFLKKLGGSSEI